MRETAQEHTTRYGDMVKNMGDEINNNQLINIWSCLSIRKMIVCHCTAHAYKFCTPFKSHEIHKNYDVIIMSQRAHTRTHHRTESKVRDTTWGSIFFCVAICCTRFSQTTLFDFCTPNISIGCNFH